MEVNALQDIFIKILRSELTETELDSSARMKLTEEVISALYDLSRKHNLAHVVSSCLYKYGLLTDNEVSKKFGKQEAISVCLCDMMQYTCDQICHIFDEAFIPYIPLKGFVIRPYYPKESMRKSCDLDFLVKEENLEASIHALEENGFTRGETSYHDVEMIAPNKMRLELHFSIHGNMERIDTVLKDAWLYASPVQGSQWQFSKEFFLFHMYAHMSYHFVTGGCGIRSLMDIWVMEHKMGIAYPQAKDLLEKGGIYKFAAEFSDLAEVCFSDKPKNEFTDTLLSYILDGGAYGTLKNRIATRKSLSNTFVYTWKRLFLPYKFMVRQFPVLKKIPVLLPFCWIVRFGRLLFGGKKGKAVAEWKTVKELPADDMAAIQQMYKHLGL